MGDGSQWGPGHALMGNFCASIIRPQSLATEAARKIPPRQVPHARVYVLLVPGEKKLFAIWQVERWRKGRRIGDDALETANTALQEDTAPLLSTAENLPDPEANLIPQ